jgi:preprotein translocase subunit SecE
MASKNPIEFIAEVRAEGNKVTWPSRRETLVTSIAVLVMIAISAAFFFLVDIVIKYGVEKGIFGL